MAHVPPLLFVSAAAAAAPVLSSHTRSLRIPGVVFEIVLGVIIGPQCLGIVEFGLGLPYLSTMGMAFLFFMAGAEIDVGAMRGPPLRLASMTWFGSLVLALLVAFGLSFVGGSQAWPLVTVALSTTALGIIVPVLRDAELLETELGKFAVAVGALGEVGPILLMSVLLARHHGMGVQTGLVAVFILAVLAVFWGSLRVRPPWLIGLLSRTMTKSGQLPIRFSMLLMACLVVLAEQFELDLALGAFASGMAVGLAVRNAHQDVLHHKFDAIGFGFLIPIFFVSSGLKLDVRALFANAGNVAMMFAYAALLLLVRGLPCLLFRRLLAQKETVALGFFSATSLSLIVALTDTAVERGLMTSESGAALVGGGLISVLVFPVVATRLTGKAQLLRVAPVGDENAY
jgi:Kef-type K+ transport system membrane component KefB